MYLDDMLVIAQRREDLEVQLQQITLLLETLGFVVNQEKSSFANNPVLGFPDRFQRDANQADKGKGDTAGVAKQGGPTETGSFGPGNSPANMEDDSHSLSCLPGTVMVLRVTVSEEPRSPSPSISQCY